jgi:hypothetical protein
MPSEGRAADGLDWPALCPLVLAAATFVTPDATLAGAAGVSGCRLRSLETSRSVILPSTGKPDPSWKPLIAISVRLSNWPLAAPESYPRRDNMRWTSCVVSFLAGKGLAGAELRLENKITLHRLPSTTDHWPSPSVGPLQVQRPLRMAQSENPVLAAAVLCGLGLWSKFGTAGLIGAGVTGELTVAARAKAGRATDAWVCCGVDPVANAAVFAADFLDGRLTGAAEDSVSAVHRLVSTSVHWPGGSPMTWHVHLPWRMAHKRIGALVAAAGEVGELIAGAATAAGVDVAWAVLTRAVDEAGELYVEALVPCEQRLSGKYDHAPGGSSGARHVHLFQRMAQSRMPSSAPMLGDAPPSRTANPIHTRESRDK